ncbi:MAG: hypothetical protein AABX11_00720 [Nanoarchaeota archaeon]
MSNSLIKTIHKYFPITILPALPLLALLAVNPEYILDSAAKNLANEIEFRKQLRTHSSYQAITNNLPQLGHTPSTLTNLLNPSN